MEKTILDAYAVHSGYDNRAPGLSLEHTWVLSGANDNWNCWGDERPRPVYAPIASGLAYRDWAREIMGEKLHPTGFIAERYDGVCHNAANRVMVLAASDVSKASGNELVIFLYGKYGFNINAYIELVKSSAAKLSVPDDEVQAVIARITNNASDELAILETHFDQHFVNHLNSLPDEKKCAIKSIYSDFQTQRSDIFGSMQEGSDFQIQYAGKLAPRLLQALNDIKDLLGDEDYQTIFKILPSEALTFLLPPHQGS